MLNRVQGRFELGRTFQDSFRTVAHDLLSLQSSLFRIELSFSCKILQARVLGRVSDAKSAITPLKLYFSGALARQVFTVLRPGPRPAPIALWRAKLTRRDGPMTIPCHGTAQKSPFVNPFADAYLPLTLAFSADHVIVTASEAN